MVPTDHLGGQFAAFVTESVWDFALGRADAETAADARVKTFDTDTTAHLAELVKRDADTWSRVPREWTPGRAELEPYVGVYRHDGYGRIAFENAGDHLIGQMGVLTLVLKPGIIDNFAGYEDLPFAPPDRFAFGRDGAGRVDCVQWGEYCTFRRV
jgi:hypothetical protein